MKDLSEYLNKEIEVIIDRPLGSKHSEKYPNHIYPVNYGYIANTISGDGDNIDVYILGVYEPIEFFKGTCIAIIDRKNDSEQKLVAAPLGTNFTNDQVKALLEFQERFYDSEIIRPDGYLEFSPILPELSVDNLEKSLNFYRILGFKIEYERPENKFAFISLGKVQLMLQEITGPNKWDLAPLSHPYGNGINFEIDLNSIDEIYERIKNSKYEITFDIEKNTYTCGDKQITNREFLIKDPDGYLLRFADEK